MSSPSQASDQDFVHAQEISETARARLRKNSHTSLQRLSCDFEQGVLTLRGRLPSFYCKQLAQVVVSGIDGVTRVVNEAQVVF